MSIKIAGLVDCFNNPEFGPLTQHRPMASTSFLGRYAFIDFPLSNFLNSNIENIGVLTQNHIRSLSKHLSSGRSWIKNTKIGELSLLYNEPAVHTAGYNTDIANLIENMTFLRDIHPDYVIICNPNFLYCCDYRALVEDHIASGQRISLLYKHIDKDLKNTFTGATKIRLNGNNKVVSMDVNVGDEDSGDVSLGCIVLDYPMLQSLIEYASSTSKFFNINDCLKYLAPTAVIRGVPFNGYVRDFDSLEHYLEYSLELLDRDVFESLFDKEWPIHTRTYDTPPTVYQKGCVVKNAYIANGCTIKGSVTNSILGRGVVIEEGAVVKNCIISNNVKISKDTIMENVIVDRDAKILHTLEIVGTKENPIYVARGDVI